MPRPFIAAALIVHAEHRIRARDELDGTVQLRFCETAATLDRMIAAGGIDAAVTELRDADDASVIPTIAAIRKRTPRLGIVLTGPPRPATFAEVPAALRAGASGDCALRGFDRLNRVLARVLTPTWRPDVARQLIDHLLPLVTPDLEVCVIACALKASPRLGLPLLMQWTRVNERTLRDRFKRAGLRAPAALIGYCAAVRAGHLLDHEERSPDHVVAAMQFTNRKQLDTLLHQYTGMSARAFQEHGGVSTLLAQAGDILSRRGDSGRASRARKHLRL